MSFPIWREKQTPQVGMVRESDAEQIEDFAFEPVRSRPNARHALDAAAGPDFQAHALVGVDGKQVVHDLERRLTTIGVMHTRQIGKVVKTYFAIAFKVITDSDDLIARDVDGELTNKLRRFADTIAKLCFQFLDEWMTARVGWLWSFFLFLYRRFRCAGLIAERFLHRGDARLRLLD